MRDDLVGNKTDLYKYALLRGLIGRAGYDCARELQLGVVWYFHSGQVARSASPKLRGLKRADLPDAELASIMRRLVRMPAANRTVVALETSGIFPESTAFFREPVAAGLRGRKKWSSRAQDAISSAQIVMLDPDLGLEVPSRPMNFRRAMLYCYFSELRQLWVSGKSLVIFQNASRMYIPSALSSRLRQLRAKRWQPAVRAFAVYVGEIHACFFVLVQPDHEKILIPRLKKFQAAWHPHVRIIPPPTGD